MKTQSYIKIFLSVIITISISYWVIYAWNWLTASDGDTLDYTKWNELFGIVDSNSGKLVWVWNINGSVTVNKNLNIWEDWSGSDGSIEIISDNDNHSYIDFRGTGNEATDFQGRIAYEDGTWLGLHVAASTTPTMFITEDGNVGIGITNPANFKFSVVWDGGASWHSATFKTTEAYTYMNLASNLYNYYLTTRDNGDFAIHRPGVGDRLTITGNGTVTWTYGTYHTASDRRLKEEIETIQDPLTKVLWLRWVTYKWKDGYDNHSRQMWVIAQEVEEFVPEAVHTVDDDIQTKSVEHEQLIWLLIEAIKEQQKQIEALKKEISE